MKKVAESEKEKIIIYDSDLIRSDNSCYFILSRSYYY